MTAKQQKWIALLSPSEQKILSELGAALKSLGCSAFLVGGAVADIFLGRNPGDLDIAIDADPAHVGALLLQQWETLCPTLPKPTHNITNNSSRLYSLFCNQPIFRTTQQIELIALGPHFRNTDIDMLSTKPLSLEQDLAQRDLTIQAIAISLQPLQFGTVIDPFNGVADLEAHVLRPVHFNVFEIDPRICVRVATLAVKLGFGLHLDTLEALKLGLHAGIFSALTGIQRFELLVKLFSEDTGPQAALLLHQHQFLPAICNFETNAIALTKLIELCSKLSSSELPILGTDRYAPYTIVLLLRLHKLSVTQIATHSFALPPAEVQSLSMAEQLLEKARLIPAT